MDQQKILLYFGILFIACMTGAVIIPYLNRKSELFSILNVFLLGSAIFVGLSCVNSYFIGPYLPYSSFDFIKFYAAIILFYITFFIVYHKAKIPHRLATLHATRRPVVSNNGLLILSIISLIIFTGQSLNIDIPGIGRLFMHLGVLAPGFSIVFSFFYIVRTRGSLLSWMLFLATFGIAVTVLFGLGGGRRSLYGAIFAIPLCMYWYWMRKMKPALVLLLLGFLCIPAAVFDIIYETVRWKGTSRSVVEVDGAEERIKMILDNADVVRDAGISRIAHMAQTGVEYSLVSIHMHNRNKTIFPPQPLHSLYCLLTVPIPRAIWPDKPLHLGMTLAFDSRMIKDGTRTNVGPGIAGHVYHEGGLHIAIFYGALMGCVLSYIDKFLLLRKKDPIWIGFIAASAFHILGWPRGAIFVFTLSPIACFFMAMIFYQITKISGLHMVQRRAPQPT